MRSDWRTVPFQDLCDITRGASPRPIHDYLGDEGIPWIKIADATSEPSRFISNTKEKIKLHGVGASVEVFPGDLILSNSATPGLPKFLRINACIHDGWMLLRNFRGLDKGFAYWLLLSERTKLVAQGNGSVFTNLKTDILKSHIVTIPPLWLQVQIAHTLNTLDDRITLLRETNATLEAMAQALFKSWFVDFDPVRAKAEGLEPESMDAAIAEQFSDDFEESALGILPKGWEFRPIGELVEGIYDGPHATPAESESGPIFLGIKNLTGTRLELANIRHISEDDWSKWTRRVEPTHGDIVFSYEATLGFFAVIPPEVRCCLGRRLALIRPHTENGAGLFWFHQFISTPFQRMLDKHTIQGATVNRIALKAFPSYLALNPPDALKLAFNDVVEPLWAAIHSNQAQFKTLTQLRDTLLPRLISGQLRLPEGETSVETMLSEAV